MTVNWGALALVAAVTVIAAIGVVGLFAVGVAAITADGSGHGPTRRATTTAVGYGCLVIAGLLAVYGLYLIIPGFH